MSSQKINVRSLTLNDVVLVKEVMKIVIQLSVNETFKSIDDSKVYRLLWIDEGNVIIYLIDVYDEKAMPF